MQRIEQPIATVLVANRGEIAVRVIRSCRELGLRSVAVHSDVDAGALHVRLADEAHRIGPAPARRSYLDVDAVLAAAKASGADAVHPGYGMLSEDAGFAAAVEAAGLVFVGPPADVVARMGDKVAARAVATGCGVPVAPGSDGTLDPADLPGATALAEGLGWPVVVKASFGGGGRGMRVVQDAGGLADAIAAAGREADAAFGRAEVHLERYLDRPRHVEVQVLADAHGTVVHLGDRDCSVQRRHQKLIEEAPAPGLAPHLRAALHDAALRVTRSVGYRGAGTVEFLVLPATGEFFFLEMNTRLQVEHGVTEMVTGIDLVAAQLRIAAGEALWFTQDDVRLDGHAVQARIAAEDPWESFRPAPGPVHELALPHGPWLRCDTGIESGDAVAAEYDSMFAKVLAWGGDRDLARRRLIGALDELRVVGVPTTAPYLRGVLATESFAAGTHDTGSVARDWAPDPADRPAATAPAPAAPATAGTVPVRRVRIATDRGPVEVAVPGLARPAGPGAAPAARPSRSGSGADAVVSGPGAPPVAPMDATVVAVAVVAGQEVGVGEVLAVLEAMKMEIEVRSDVAGTVQEVLVAPGDPVAAGKPLVRFTT
ncbi:acetyl/propionyl/methylcrotonyl-CoA carboxylase subunit alpha [Pseudonocardia broussonetiae]|uniref:ATP-grasp domain-containing protein n=1 Tax=Pseudonocardia broussonetiae TaxID=2736640 RepID=A0A6M6JE81_9PSEU|nr:biotin carboxylase N-terminal domain-containing protein [Pseudonocardia broussonetiae]QJY45413.1 ATP-grasp domain-containing protein [Pseudonocardia broussonetiae]